MRDIQLPVGLDQESHLAEYAAAGFVATAAAGLAAWLWARKRRERTPEPAPAAEPHQTALESLLELNCDDPARFGEQFSRILRDYIETRYGVYAPEAPTGEFLALLFKSVPFDGASQGGLRSLFYACDLMKYAGDRPSPAELRSLAANAVEWIAATRIEMPSTGAAVLFR